MSATARARLFREVAEAATGAALLLLASGCMTENEAAYAGSRIIQSQARTPAEALFFGLAGDIFATRSIGEQARGNEQHSDQNETPREPAAAELVRRVQAQNGGNTKYSFAFERWNDDGDGTIDVGECSGIADYFYLPAISSVTFMTDASHIPAGTTVHFYLYREQDMTREVLSHETVLGRGRGIVQVTASTTALARAGISGRYVVNWRAGSPSIRPFDVYSVTFVGAVQGVRSPATGYSDMDEFFRRFDQKYEQKDREFMRR